MWHIALRIYTRLLLFGFALAMSHKVSMAALPQTEAEQTIPSQDSTDRKGDNDQRDIRPLPEAGETAYFRYVRDSGDMYRIMPTDGSQPYLVSGSFLQVTLNSPNLDGFQQAEILRSYPTLAREMFTKTMVQAYPDATVEYDEPFSARSFEGTDGTQVLLEQDPAATPYIRARLISNEGEPVEFSVARAVVEQMLANKKLTNDQLITGLQSVPFKLPEAARTGGFARLSAAELAMLVQNDPELRQYDFVRMAGLASNGTETHSAETPRQLAPPPSVAPTRSPPIRETGEQPRSNFGVYTPGIQEPFHVAEPMKGAPAAETESVSAGGVRTRVLRLGLQILGVSLFIFGIFALLISRRTQ
jgi:hypothetical protein